MLASERLLRITERIGMIIALTFNRDQSETQSISFNESHIRKCVAISYILTWKQKLATII